MRRPLVVFVAVLLSFSSLNPFALAQTDAEKSALALGKQLIESFYKSEVAKLWELLDKDDKDFYTDLPGLEGFTKKQLAAWGKEQRVVSEEAKADGDGVLYNRVVVFEKDSSQQWQFVMHFTAKNTLDLFTIKLLVAPPPPADG
jgi:hypothetical protein